MPYNAWLYDTFTDVAATNLTAHVADSGATWAKQTGVTGDFAISAGTRVRGISVLTGECYVASATPPSADYAVYANFRRITNSAFIGVIGRANSADQVKYGFYYDPTGSGAGWQLSKYDAAGGQTVLVSSAIAVDPLVNDRTYVMALWMRGTRIMGIIDGKPVASVSDATIAGPGKAGLVGFGTPVGDTDGNQIEDLWAVDIGAGFTRPSPKSPRPAPYKPGLPR